MGLFQLIMGIEEPYKNVKEVVGKPHSKRTFLGALLEGLDAIATGSLLTAVPSEAHAEDPNVDEIEYYKAGKFEELVGFYTEELGQQGLLLPKRTELYCKRSIAKVLRANQEPDKIDKYVRDAFSDINATNRGMIPDPPFNMRESCYRDLAAYFTIVTVQLACDRDSEYNVPKDIQIMMEYYVRNRNEDFPEKLGFDMEGDYLNQFGYDVPVILGQIASASFIGKLLDVFREIPGLEKEFKIKTERIMR